MYMQTRRAWTITPLIFAAKMGHLDMCSLLLARGATLDGPVQVRARRKCEPG